MLKECIADVSVLLFFGSFFLPFVLLFQIFVKMFLPDMPWIVYILPLLFGFSSSYVINKGHNSGFVKRTFFTSLILFISFFGTFYLMFFVINNILTNLERGILTQQVQTPKIFQLLFEIKAENLYLQSAIPSAIIFAGAMIDAIFKRIFEKKS